MSQKDLDAQQLLQAAVNRDDELRQSPPTAQFLIGGTTGGGAGGIKSGNPDEVTHPLQKLDPDSWNNIPICLVKAVKMLIDSNISTDQKMRQFNNNTDTSVRKLTAAIAKNEKDLTKKEEQLKALIDRMEKHLTTNFTQKTNDLEAMCWRNRDSTNDINNKFGKELHDVGMRLDNMMTGAQIKDHVEFALDHQLGLIRLEYKEDLFRVETILNKFTGQFEIPGVVGDKNAQYSSVHDFIKDTYKQNQKSFEKIQLKLHDFEHKQFKDVRTDIGKLQGHVDKFNQNFNDEFWKQQHKLTEDLKNFSTSLIDQNEKMRQMDSTVSGRIKSSQDMMFDIKSEMELKQLTIDQIKKQIGDIRGDIGEHATQIRNVGQDLANCQQKVTKIDRAQASQAQMSMASFHEPKSGIESKAAFSKKVTGGPPSDNNAASSNNVISNAEVEKLKVRMVEVERILMSQELTMKKLGDEEAEAIVTANHSSSAGTSLNNKSAAKFDRDWTQKVELKLSKITSTIKGLTNKITDIMHGNNGINRDHIYVGGNNNITLDQHRRSQSLLTGSQNSLKFGAVRGDGTPGNSEYNRRGTATAGANGGSRKKNHKNSSQNNSNGTLENGINQINQINTIENAKIKYQGNLDGSRSTSPPSTAAHNQNNRRSSGGNAKNVQSPHAPRDHSIDEKTTKHMMRIAEMINQMANTDLQVEHSNKKKGKHHFPTVEDVYIQLSPGNNSGSRSPKNDILNGPLIGDKLFGLHNQQRRAEGKNGQTPSSQVQRQGRQFAQTPNANVPELQLATFSNQINGHGVQGNVKPLYIINEEKNIMMQRGGTGGGFGQATVLPNLDLKKTNAFKKQPAAQMLNDEMQAIIRGGQMIQTTGNRASAHHHRRIPSSQMSNRQNSPRGEPPSYLQSGMYHQQPLSVKFEGMQQFSGPSAAANASTGITSPMMRR